VARARASSDISLAPPILRLSTTPRRAGLATTRDFKTTAFEDCFRRGMIGPAIRGIRAIQKTKLIRNQPVKSARLRTSRHRGCIDGTTIPRAAASRETTTSRRSTAAHTDLALKNDAGRLRQILPRTQARKSATVPCQHRRLARRPLFMVRRIFIHRRQTRQRSSRRLPTTHDPRPMPLATST